MSLSEIDFISDLKEYLLEIRPSRRAYRHYTNLDGLLGMIRSKHFWLSRMDQMNDKQEISKLSIKNWDNIFVFSLAYGLNENMAMWGLYGVPRDEAVRITFTTKSIIETVSSSTRFKSIEDYIELGNVELSLVDVLYIGASDENNCTHVLKRGTQDVRHLNIFEVGDLIDIQSGDTFAGMLKNAAWVYENEARIRAVIDNRYLDLKKIAIPYSDDLLSSIKITLGPGIKNKERIIEQLCAESEGLITEERISISEFDGLVHYRQLCEYCDNEFVRKATD